VTERFRIEERAAGEFVAQVRRFWWWPWDWADINRDGVLIERWDNSGTDYPTAHLHIKAYQKRKGYPRWFFPPEAALSGVAAQIEGDKSREDPISTPPPPTDGEVK